MAIAPEGGDEDQDETAADFSAEDARQELERLREDEQPAAASADSGGMCALPAQVPSYQRVCASRQR